MSAHLGDDAELYALGLLEPERRAEIDAHVAGCADCLRLLGEAEATAAALADTLPSLPPSAAAASRFAAAVSGLGSGLASEDFAQTDPGVAAVDSGVARVRSGVAPAGPRVASAFRGPGEPRWGWFAGLAIAAALLVALGTSWYQIGSLRGQAQGTRIAVATLVHSHFLHVSMTVAPAAGGLAAKVIYARDGSWLYVLVDGTQYDRPAGDREAGGRTDGPLELTATIAGKPYPCGRLVLDGRTATLFIRPPGRPERVQLSRGGTILASATLAY